MAGTEEFVRFLAMWALVHETADEGWKAAVVRGAAAESGDMDAGPEAFVDGLSALVAQEKDRLKAQLSVGKTESAQAEVGTQLDELRFEVGELRGMIESIQASLDALAHKRDQ